MTRASELIIITFMKYEKNQYPAQVRLDKRIVDLCRLKSVELPGCPRPQVGSFGHFVKVALREKLLTMVKRPEYINELFGVEL